MVTDTPSDFSASTPSVSTVGRRASDGAVAAMEAVRAPSHWRSAWWWFIAVVVASACALSMALAWKAQRQVSLLEQELVRRQESSQNHALEAQTLAKQAQEAVRDSVGKVAVLEARMAEVAVQRGQLEELIQSLSRSRDENVVLDIEAAVRVAVQQIAITGSAEPLVAALKQSDERLARYNQPRLQGIRRAIVRDLDRVHAAGATDIAALTIRLDEAVRLVDDLPLLSAQHDLSDAPPTQGASVGSPAASSTPASPSAVKPVASPASVAASEPSAWWQAGREVGQRIWGEVRSLVRVSRIDHPDAVLLAPEQAFFLRENLKLRLLNARLALLSRQFDTAQADLKVVQDAIQRYFDPQSRRTSHAAEVVRQVSAQSRAVAAPRPDDTLAALAAVEAGR